MTNEKRLLEAADQLRANSGLKDSQFSRPIIRMGFLIYMYYRFNSSIGSNKI